MTNLGAKLYLKKDNAEKNIDLPIINATVGESVIDVRSIKKELDVFTFDPGYMSTASCKSSITYIDGDIGILAHRGYKIEYLAENKNFLEVAYLLLCEEFPNKEEYRNFEQQIIAAMEKSIKSVEDTISSFDRKAHPMSILIGCMSKISAMLTDRYYTMQDKAEKVSAITDRAIFTIGSVAGIVAIIQRYLNGKKAILPKADLTFSENFLYIMFAENSRSNYKPTKAMTEAIDKLLVLHADHEQNASTSTVRSVGSTGASLISSVIGGLCALSGPLHGGANEEVIEMFQKISSIENVENYVKKAETGETKLMGFGHRVYKNNDPRATVIKKYCDRVLSEVKDKKLLKMLDIATAIEKKALKEEYFIKRKLFPNVDFYSGIIYSAIGIPSKMFTPMFAVARTVGWVSQWKEMLMGDDFKISRPRQLYIGEKIKQ